MKKILVVAAHPDDEVLGCGGTVVQHVEKGDQVNIVFMADGVTSRVDSFTDEDVSIRNEAACESCRILGTQSPVFLGFPDNRLDTVALLDVVQALEKEIIAIQPSVIYTHHSEDLNVDHRITHQAVFTACRPQVGNSVNEIYSFEVLSSTEWSSPSEKSYFIPNRFVDISNVMKRKIEALHAYKEELREFPHSRSIETVELLARYRGSTMGMQAAEAFQVERILIK